eukprot:scpid40298/ scgid29807/ 
MFTSHKYCCYLLAGVAVLAPESSPVMMLNTAVWTGECNSSEAAHVFVPVYCFHHGGSSSVLAYQQQATIKTMEETCYLSRSGNGAQQEAATHGNGAGCSIRN